MGFDIRLPIGIMFSSFGLLLAAYGAATRGSDIYARHSLGINVNSLVGDGDAGIRSGYAALGAPRIEAPEELGPCMVAATIALSRFA